MKKNDRNNRILALRFQGRTLASIAEEFDMSPSTVTTIVRNNRYYMTDRIVPSGMSAKTAFMIELAIGIWPSPANAAAIASRRIDVLRSAPISRAKYKEMEDWLAEMGEGRQP